MLEGALSSDTEQLGGQRAVHLAEDVGQLGRRPHVRQPLDAVGVRVERGGEGALGGEQVAQHELARFAGDPLTEGVAGEPPPVGVDPGELGVVVEHLLEMRHHPCRVDGIPREAPAELVVHPAAGHGLARRVDHGQGERRARPGVVADQELQHHRRRELRRAPETAVVGVEPGGQGLDGMLQHGLVDVAPRPRSETRPDRLGHLRRARADLLAAGHPGLTGPQRAGQAGWPAAGRCRTRTAPRRPS